MKKISEEIVVDNGWRKVYRSDYQDSHGNKIDMLIYGNSQGDGNGAMIIAITKEKKILLLKEFRYGPEKYMFNFPAGSTDANESSKETAIRECLEETWYSGSHCVQIGTCINNYYMRGNLHLYLITGVEQIQNQDTHLGEDISLEEYTLEEFESMIVRGDIVCSYTVHTYFLAKEKTKNFTCFDF